MGCNVAGRLRSKTIVNDYDALRDYLKKQSLPEFVLSFEQIEEIIDAALPRASHRASWWDSLRSPDIQMPQRSGLDVVAGIDPATLPLVIFVTAHDDHAIHESDDERVYPNICRSSLNHQHTEAPFQPDTNYRFRVPDGAVIHFHDQNLGPQSFTAGIDFGDFLIWRKDNLPSYQLACIVDDADTQITDVVRGRDLLKSTARQILLQQTLLLPTPAYFHTSLMLDANGQRLAKRHYALSLRTLRTSDITPQQIIQRISQPL